MPFNIYGQRLLTPPTPPDPGTLGAVEWHRADAVTTTGALIDTFADLGPNGYTMVLSGGNVNTRATQLPTSAPNGQPSASCPNPFGGQTTGYHCSTFNETIQQIDGAWSMFCVCKPDAAVNGNLIYRTLYANTNNTTQTDDGNVFQWSPFDDDPWWMAFYEAGNSFGKGEATSAPGDWVYLLQCCDWAGGGLANYVLGGLNQTSGIGNVVNPRTCDFATFLRNSQGGVNASNFRSFYGEVADFALFDYSLHSAGTVGLLNDYVEDRYGPTMVANAGARRDRAWTPRRPPPRRPAPTWRQPVAQLRAHAAPPEFQRRGRVYVPATWAGTDQTCGQAC